MSVIQELVEQNQTVSQKQISILSNIDVMTISSSLKTLIKNDYVRREENQHDGRAYSLVLTRKGKEVLYKTINVVEDIDESFFGKLTGEELSSFKKLLEKIAQSN